MRHIPLLLAVALCACTEAPERAQRPAQRKEQAEAALAKTPMPRTYRIGEDELKVIDVPVQDASGFVDSQRCFVWRDRQYGSASLSCNQAPDIQVADPHALVR